MRLVASADALEFAASVRELLARSASSEALRAAWDSPDGRVPGVWESLGEMGALGLVVPERYDGAGLDLTAAVPLLVEAGRSCLPSPLLETVAAAVVLAAAGGDAAAEWLPKVASGAAVALATGPGGLLSGAGWADVALVADGQALRLAAATELRLEPASSADAGIRLAAVTHVPAAAPAIGGAAAVEQAQDVAAVCAAAVLCGLAQAMLDMAVAYAKTREQFGVVIGSFQALKHQLADVYVANSFAVPVVNRAAWSVARDLPSRSRDASHAKLAASAAAARAARTALQVHAGIGYTFEHDLHMWLKRTWTLRSLYGDDAWHRARLAVQVLADGPPPRVP